MNLPSPPSRRDPWAPLSPGTPAPPPASPVGARGWTGAGRRPAAAAQWAGRVACAAGAAADRTAGICDDLLGRARRQLDVVQAHIGPELAQRGGQRREVVGAQVQAPQPRQVSDRGGQRREAAVLQPDVRDAPAAAADLLCVAL